MSLPPVDGAHVRGADAVVQSSGELATTSVIRSLVDLVLGPQAFLVRSIFFDKLPQANWKVAWHQDLTICVQKKADVPGFGPWSSKAGVQHTYFEAPGTAHEFQTWRKSLYGFAPLLFRK